MRTIENLDEPDIILAGISSEELNRHKKAVRDGLAVVSLFTVTLASNSVSMYYNRTPMAVRYLKKRIDL
jgi:hypothetical protein